MAVVEATSIRVHTNLPEQLAVEQLHDQMAHRARKLLLSWRNRPFLGQHSRKCLLHNTMVVVRLRCLNRERGHGAAALEEAFSPLHIVTHAPLPEARSAVQC